MTTPSTMPPQHVHRSIRKDRRLLPSADALRDRILYGKAKEVFSLKHVRYPLRIAARDEREVCLACESPRMSWEFVIPLELRRHDDTVVGDSRPLPSVVVVVSCLSVLSQL